MSLYFPTDAECGHHHIFGSVAIRTYAGEKIQLSVVDIPADSCVEWHAHPNEQMGMIVSGQLRFEIGDEVKVLGPGELYFIPGGVRHRAKPVDGPVRALDVFYPIRDEYR